MGVSKQDQRKLRRLIRAAFAGTEFGYVYENVDKMEGGRTIHNLTISWVELEANPDAS